VSEKVESHKVLQPRQRERKRSVGKEFLE